MKRFAARSLGLLTGPALAGPRPCAGAEPEDGHQPAEPLWECGVLGGFTRLPDYKGSDQYTVYAVPLPYFVYRAASRRTSTECRNRPAPSEGKS